MGFISGVWYCSVLLQTTEPDGKKILRVMYQHPGDDISGILSRSEKIVNTCEKVGSIMMGTLNHVKCNAFQDDYHSDRLDKYLRHQSKTITERFRTIPMVHWLTTNVTGKLNASYFLYQLMTLCNFSLKMM